MFTKIVKSGDLFEIYTYEKEPSVRQRIVKRGTCRHKECRWKIRCLRKPPNPRKEKNLYRAKKSFYRLVRSNLDTPPALITLTMASVVPYSTAIRYFTKFVTRLKRQCSGFKFVSVPEFQKRGAVHFHLFVWGLTDQDIYVERYSRRIANLWGYGYVDVVKTDGSPKLAGYLAKYMSKSMSDYRLMGKKAYSCSRNLMRPLSLSSHKMPTAIDFVLKEWGVDNSLAPEKEREYNTQWLGKSSYRLYVIKK